MKSIESVASLQHYINDLVYEAGGYWSPLTTVCRLLEEIGEFVHAVKLSMSTLDLRIIESADELADIYITGTCLANQYSVFLGEEYKKAGIPEDFIQEPDLQGRDNRTHADLAAIMISDEFSQLLWCASSIARTIGAYEGEKKTKPGEKVQTMGFLTANLHKLVIALSQKYALPLGPALLRVLHKAKKRDKNRFVYRFCPATAENLESIPLIHEFNGKKARLWSSPLWNPDLSTCGNVMEIIPHLKRFIRISRHEQLDGFIIDVINNGPDEERIKTPPAAALLEKILKHLTENDAQPGAGRCHNSPAEQSWFFVFAGQPFSVSVLTPNTDFVPGGNAVPHTFFLFKPLYAEDAAGKGDDNGNLACSCPKAFKQGLCIC